MHLSANPPAVYSPTTYYGTFSDIASSAASGYLGPSGTVVFALFAFLTSSRFITSTSASTGASGRMSSPSATPDRSAAICCGSATSIPCPPGADFLNLNPQNKNPQIDRRARRPISCGPTRPMATSTSCEFATNSNYHALLLSVAAPPLAWPQRRAPITPSVRLWIRADSYSSAVDPFLDPRSRNYGPAGFNRAQVFTGNFYYNLPKPGKMTGSGLWVGSPTTGSFPASRAC